MSDLDIKQLRADFGLTQAELAKLVAVDPKTIQNWENGKTIPEGRYAQIREIFRSLKPSQFKKVDVRAVREKLNLKQEELATMLGVHLRTIQNWESGTKIPEAKATLIRELEGKSKKRPFSETAQVLWRRILRATGIRDHRSVDSNISARRVVERLHGIGDGIRLRESIVANPRC